MRKIKMISSASVSLTTKGLDKLQERVNRWLKSHKNMNIINVTTDVTKTFAITTILYDDEIVDAASINETVIEVDGNTQPNNK